MHPAYVQTIYVVPSPTIPQQLHESQGQQQQQQCIPLMYCPPPIYCYSTPPTATQQHHDFQQHQHQLLPMFPALNTTMEGSTNTNGNFVPSNSVLSISSSLGLDVSSNSNYNNNGASKQMKFKTSLCRSFASPGQQCPYGEKCQFAHGERELRPIPPK
eukprot:PhF_6_TR33653/c5_g2_i8/m.49230